jgi:hypothetical protein
MAKGIYKTESLRVSERVWDIVAEKIRWYIDNGYKLDGYLQPFNNCRETGLFLTITNEDWDNKDRVLGQYYIWVCEARSSDEIMICMQTEYPEAFHKFGEEAYKNAKYFHYNQYYEAAEYIVEAILKYFKLED